LNVREDIILDYELKKNSKRRKCTSFHKKTGFVHKLDSKKISCGSFI